MTDLGIVWVVVIAAVVGFILLQVSIAGGRRG